MLKVETLDPRFLDLVDVESDLVLLSDQFQFTEGPIWDSQNQELLFSDIADSTTWTWTEQKGFCALRRNTNKGNGNAWDQNGNIITCEHAKSRIVRTHADGTDYEVLVSHYKGKELNAPNDVIVKSDGTIWFSDPWFGRKPTWIGVGRPLELDFEGVYRFDPKDESLVLASKEFVSPNGLCFTLDEKQMYVADTPEHKIYVFDVEPEGTLSHRKVLADTAYQGEGGPDGLKIDSQGNIYCAAQGGLHVYAPDGTRLGVVQMPGQTANFCFGGPDLKTLYMTAVSSIYSIRLKVPGNTMK